MSHLEGSPRTSSNDNTPTASSDYNTPTASSNANTPSAASNDENDDTPTAASRKRPASSPDSEQELSDCSTHDSKRTKTDDELLAAVNEICSRSVEVGTTGYNVDAESKKTLRTCLYDFAMELFVSAKRDNKDFANPDSILTSDKVETLESHFMALLKKEIEDGFITTADPSSDSSPPTS